MSILDLFKPTKKNYIEDAQAFYLHNLSHKYGSPIGSSIKEIKQCEHAMGVRFPEAYKQFLLWMGNDYNGIFEGSDWFIRDIVHNTEYLKDLLSENEISIDDSQQFVVFFSHQGYMASWFNVPTTNPDPPCHFFTESFEETQIETVESFSSFLLKDLGGIAECTVGQEPKSSFDITKNNFIGVQPKQD